jgi:N-acetylmuramidase-like protein/putative peptidoglycan binding protein
MSRPFTGAAVPLTQPGLNSVLETLGVAPPDLWAVLTVETRGCGFLADRRPLILFERHIFHRRTQGEYDAGHPSISSSVPGGYLGGASEYLRLEEAAALDRSAALNSVSWGIGQIMGFNCRAAGFDSAEAMVAAMMNGEDAQLAAMANFLRSEGLHAALAGHDWPGFARGYNGQDFAKNQYDARLESAFYAFANGPLPDLTVRQTQVLLMFLGIDTGAIDGVAGKRTRSGIRTFREQSGLPPSDAIDDRFLAALLMAAGQGAIAGPH